MRVVDVLVDEGVRQHLTRAQHHEQMTSHVVGQVGHDSCAPPGLLD